MDDFQDSVDRELDVEGRTLNIRSKKIGRPGKLLLRKGCFSISESVGQSRDCVKSSIILTSSGRP